MLENSKWPPERITEVLERMERRAKTIGTDQVSYILLERDLPSAVCEIQRLGERLAGSKKLQEFTLTNEIRWMRKHENLLTLIASLQDWKSPDGVLQVKDLNWFKELPLQDESVLDAAKDPAK